IGNVGSHPVHRIGDVIHTNFIDLDASRAVKGHRVDVCRRGGSVRSKRRVGKLREQSRKISSPAAYVAFDGCDGGRIEIDIVIAKSRRLGIQDRLNERIVQGTLVVTLNTTQKGAKNAR